MSFFLQKLNGFLRVFPFYLQILFPNLTLLYLLNESFILLKGLIDVRLDDRILRTLSVPTELLDKFLDVLILLLQLLLILSLLLGYLLHILLRNDAYSLLVFLFYIHELFLQVVDLLLFPLQGLFVSNNLLLDFFILELH